MRKLILVALVVGAGLATAVLPAAPQASANPLTSVAAVAGEGYHTCALTSPGGVKCWGDNAYGQPGRQHADVGPGVLEAAQHASSVPVIISLRQEEGAETSGIAGAQRGLLSTVTSSEFQVTYAYRAVMAISGRLTLSGIQKLTANPDVEAVSLAQIRHVAMSESIPLIRADVAHSLGIDGTGTVVAVLDTGIDTDHVDLESDLLSEKCFLEETVSNGGGSCPGGTGSEVGPGSAEDDNGHGTSVSGIITGDGTASPIGVAPRSKIRAYKVCDASGDCSDGDILAALDDILAESSDVQLINMSLGHGSYSSECDGAAPPALVSVLQDLRAAGALAFASSGNAADKSGIELPACLSPVVSVGAVYDSNVGGVSYLVCSDTTTGAGYVVCHSNSAPALDLLAPGGCCINTASVGGGQTGNGLSGFGGTSAAAPHAVGAAALVLSADPTLSPDTIVQCLRDGGVPITDPANAVTTPLVDVPGALHCSDPSVEAPAWCSDGICEQWVSHYGQGHDNLTDIAVDDLGNAYVTGSLTYPYAGYGTVKFDDAGRVAWARRWDNSSGGPDTATAIALDGNEGIYVTGEGGEDSGGGTYRDYVTIKYNAVGTQLWLNRYRLPDYRVDVPRALAVDGSGNVLVTGSCCKLGPSFFSDFATVKYGSGGTELWEHALDGGANKGDEAVDVVVDSDGNAYVTGILTTSTNSVESATVKYDGSGNLLWIKTRPSSSGSYGSAIALATGGGVYVTGATVSEVVTMKYAADGTLLWEASHPGFSTSRIEVGATDEIWVMADSLIRYDADGTEVCTSNLVSDPIDLAVDDSGAYVVGSGATQWQVTKFSPSCQPVWEASYAANGEAVARTVAIDAEGNVYVGGHTNGANPSRITYTVIKYVLDSDLDGCSDPLERQTTVGSELKGGRRDPSRFWDYYDVWTHPYNDLMGWERNGTTDLFGDIFGVAIRFGATGTVPASEQERVSAALTPPTSDTGYHIDFDRSAPTGPNVWNMGPPDGTIDLFTDIFGVAYQFGHDCT